MDHPSHKRRAGRLCLLAAAAILLVVIGCQTMQNVGKTITTSVQGVVQGFTEAKEARQLGTADEDELGQAVAILVTNKYAPSDDKKLIRYVNMVGYTLVSASSKPDGHYVFAVLDTDDIGAYSGPNGYIMITRGAIHSMRDEGELAGVLAHELTHVIKQHGLVAARAAAQRAGYMDAAKAVLQQEDAIKFIDSGMDAIVRNGYDKPDEDAADSGAVELMLAAGYDPRCYAHYLSHLAAMQEAAAHRPAQQGAINSAIKEIMSTHPGIPDRFQAVNKQIAAAGNVGGAVAGDRFQFYLSE